MRFTVNRKILLENLKTMIGLVPNASPKHELQCFLFEANEDEGYLYLSVNNLHCAIQRKTEANVEEGGSIVIHARMIYEILTALGDDNVTFTQNKAGFVYIQSGRSEYNIAVLSEKLFPVPEMPFPDSTIAVHSLKNFYDKTSTVSQRKNKDNEKSVSRGIHFDIGDKKIKVMAFDKNKVALTTQNLDSDSKLSFTLSKEVYDCLASAVGDDEIEVGTCGNTIVFMKKDFLFSAQKLDQPYPDVIGLLGKLKYEYAAKVEHGELKNTLSNICDMASLGSETSYVKMRFLEDKIEMSTQNDVVSGSNSVEVTRVKGCDEMTFYYNVKSLKNVLKTVEGTLIIGLDKKGNLNVMDKFNQYMISKSNENHAIKQIEKSQNKKTEKLSKRKTAKAA